MSFKIHIMHQNEVTSNTYHRLWVYKHAPKLRFLHPYNDDPMFFTIKQEFIWQQISKKLNLAWQRKQRIQKYRLLCDTYNSNEMQTESAVQCTQTPILQYTVRFREWLLCLTIVTEFEFKSVSPSISVNIEMALNYDLFVTKRL